MGDKVTLEHCERRLALYRIPTQGIINIMLKIALLSFNMKFLFPETWIRATEEDANPGMRECENAGMRSR
jgi:hypothetical protein